jgi:hypothetical protein
MAPTYELIASNTLSSAAASVTFSSIPATYTDLLLKISARSSDSGGAFGRTCTIRVNSDSGSNYSNLFLRATGTAVISAANQDSTSFNSQTDITGDTATASSFSSLEAYFPNYGSTANRPVSFFNVNETNGINSRIYGGAGLYRGGSAVESMTIETPDLFLANSSFFLYGIKNS